ncbi:BREX-1 system adenine-specific DNA-methyltransferase PglX [Desulfosediminicola sp.]|uniref:BREX-1 system adenine-specific DNA-methyltransferase PglX n=1 Tax=Desulfosediminicola sp. TaxID=2886825 RepID=UPI003AF2C2C5
MSGLRETTKSSFKQCVNAIRNRLLEDLEQACYQRYSLNAKDRSKVQLTYQENYLYKRLFAWLEDPARAHKNWRSNLKDLIKARAYTLTNRLVILMQLECRDLRKVKLISQGIEKSVFRTEQEFFVALTQGDDQGFSFILQQVWDQLALELPALFQYNEVHQCIPIPGTTLLWMIQELNQEELQEAWKDDTTLGWLYQYWNDPDRKAVDAKLKNTSGKVEAHELSDKTQLFTERYMVEWLVQNSLGAQWLAICAKNGWACNAKDKIEKLILRRAEWNKRTTLKEVLETEAMPINGDEEFWKYYVPQDLAEETIEAAPLSLEKVKILDPAMGSGHFLVYVFDFLWELYQDQARLSKKNYTPKQIIDWILKNNLHGIDIDNRAVQIGAAALYIKTQEKETGYQVENLNLVASDLGISHLKEDDPAIVEFIEILEDELGLNKNISLEIINALKGAEYLGSLLQVEKEIERIVRIYRLDTSALDVKEVQEKIFQALANFIQNHDQGEDLGVRSLAEQMGKGLRLIELLGQKYDVIVANPPYLGVAKVNKSIGDQIQLYYQDGKADLYSVFMLKAFQLVSEYGKVAMVTLRGWMFLTQFDDVRLKLIRESNFLSFGDLHLGAFSDMKDVSATMFVYQKSNLKRIFTKIVRPVPKLQIRRDQYQVDKNTRGLLLANEVYSFSQSRFAEIPGSPMIYWWPEEIRQAYIKAPKLAEIAEVKQGMSTANNVRYVRYYWEVDKQKIMIQEQDSLRNDNNTWAPYVKGAEGKRWYQSLSEIVLWEKDGQQVVLNKPKSVIRNATSYFKQGISFNSIGTDGFLCRLRKFKSIFADTGSSIFCCDPEKLQVVLSSNLSGYISHSLNPTIHNQVGDIERLPYFEQITGYTSYINRAKSLYKQIFASTESNLEYRYQQLSSGQIEVEEARIRDEIDKELLQHFSKNTILSIHKEIGESVFDYPHWDGERDTIPQDFAKSYQAEFSLLSLSRKYRLHPDSLLLIKDELGLSHEGYRKAKAFKDLSWAIGVLLGIFDAQTGGLVDLADERRKERIITPDIEAPQGHPHGLLYLSSLDDQEGLNREELSNSGKACLLTLKAILEYKWGSEKSNQLWDEIQNALVLDCRTDWTPAQRSKKNLNTWIRTSAFEMHSSIYQKRPIYFPLTSAKKNFFLWVNIHKWDDGTLNSILANYLNPDISLLENRIRRLREERHSIKDNRQLNAVEMEIAGLDKLLDELKVFTAKVSLLATRGPAPENQEVETPYVMDLNDGVMVNSAALWELVLPLWKDPKKWWTSLSTPKGKKDFDWSHLAMRYWPNRVMAKVKKDPSLAVAHSDYGEYKGRDLFEELHPEAAKKWNAQQNKQNDKQLELDF